MVYIKWPIFKRTYRVTFAPWPRVGAEDERLLPIAGIPLSLERFAADFAQVFGHPSQYQCFKEMLIGLIVSDNKTVAGVNQKLISETSYDSLRRFMSRSPWSVEELQKARLSWAKEHLPENAGEPVTVPIGCTLLNHVGENIHGVHLYYDYAKKAYALGQRLVLSSYACSIAQIPLGKRLYQRAYLDEQKVYLEAMKPSEDAGELAKQQYQELVRVFQENEKKHRTQPQLAEELVDECEEVGFKKDAYVLDGALLTRALAEKIESHSQAWISRLAKSRLVQAAGSRYLRIDAWAKTLPKNVFKKVEVTTRKGDPRVYWCFSKCVKVKNWKKVRVVISFDNENLIGEPIFIVTNKLNWSQPQKVVQLYTYRDPIEHLIRDEKQELGFEECQLQGQEAVEKNWELSFLADTYLELGFDVELPPGMSDPGLATIGHKTRLLEYELAQAFAKTVSVWTIEGRDIKERIDHIFEKRLNGLAS